jgi:hypothetical protein
METGPVGEASPPTPPVLDLGYLHEVGKEDRISEWRRIADGLREESALSSAPAR